MPANEKKTAWLVIVARAPARLGRVGNSGNASESHLYIHSVRQGSGSALEWKGVPILFDGRIRFVTARYSDGSPSRFFAPYQTQH